MTERREEQPPARRGPETMWSKEKEQPPRRGGHSRPPIRMNSHLTGTTQQKEQRNNSLEHIAILSKEQKQKQGLWELYKSDFELFGYSPDGYL